MATRSDLEELAEFGAQAENLCLELITRYTGKNDILVRELRHLKNVANELYRTSINLCKVRDFRGYKFAIIDKDTGEIRTATKDEAYRIMMGYPRGDVSVMDMLQEIGGTLQKEYSDRIEELFQKYTLTPTEQETKK